jgi:hypothetical protein
LLDPPLLLHEDLADGCGGMLWPAGMRLAKYILKMKKEEIRNAESMCVSSYVEISICDCDLSPRENNCLTCFSFSVELKLALEAVWLGECAVLLLDLLFSYVLASLMCSRTGIHVSIACAAFFKHYRQAFLTTNTSTCSKHCCMQAITRQQYPSPYTHTTMCLHKQANRPPPVSPSPKAAHP